VHADESSVRVITSDSKQVEFIVRHEGFATAQIGNQLHIDSQQSGDQVDLTVRVTAGVAVGFNNQRISAEVHMPHDADLLIETHDGAIRVSAVNGHVDLHTADGAITMDTLKGEARLQTKDGTVSATNVDGKLTAISGDGTIRAEGRFDFLDLKSGDGSVRARITQGSKMGSEWNIRTVDGSVTVALPTDFRASLDASTRDGSIGVNLPLGAQEKSDRRHVRGTINGGGPVLAVHTEDGSIRVNGL
jgi:DUF4097 and DUF4098 domain-containing protein YvlB